MLITPTNSLIAIAADLEWPHFTEALKDWRLVKTGIGKVAALNTVLAEYQKKPFEIIINLGSVGNNSTEIKVGEILQSKQILERDNPFSAGAINPPKLKSPKLPSAVLGTGDNFVEKDNLPLSNIQIVDMEGYALARLAETLGIKFIAVKIVSDYCTIFKDWEKNVGSNSKKLAKFFIKHEFKL